MLQYKRRSTEQGSGPVDWDEVDVELSQVNPAFQDPRFDSLKHVLTVLGSENAEAEVEQLQEQRARIEDLVDAVVEGYHSGFNKSIHNYSQILRLFTESKLQLESLRRSLESAQRRLSAQSRHMAAQWHRHVMLSDTLRLLGDIALVAELPQRVQRLEEGKEWAAAVMLLLDGCNKLARQELSQVGALAELREEMGKRRSSLQDSIVGELEARIYKLEAAPAQLGAGASVEAGRGSGGSSGSGAGPLGAGGAAAPGPGAAGVPRLQLPPRVTGGGSSEGEGGGGSAALLPNSARPAGGITSWGSSAQLAPPPLDLAPGISGALPRRPVHRRAHTSTGLLNPVGALTSVDGHLVDPEVPLPTLVDCLAQIGGIADAQAALRKHMPQRLRGAILRALELFPASKHLPPDERFHPSHLHPAQSSKQQLRSGGAGGASMCDAPIPPEVAATAQALVEHVLSCSLQVLQKVVQLLHMLAHARAPKPSSGLELLLAQQRLQQQRAALPPPPVVGALQGPADQLLQSPQQAQQQQPQQAQQPAGPPAERAKEECQAAWDALQGECERLLGCVLHVQQAPPGPGGQQGGGGQGDVPGSGWLASGSYLGPGDGTPEGHPSAAAAAAAVLPLDPGTLTFSLVHEVADLLPAAAGGAGGDGGEGAAGEGGGAGAAQEEGGAEHMGRLVRKILGGHPGGSALVPGLYRPVLQFAEAGEQLLSSVAAGSGGSEGGSRILSQLFSMPWRSASDSGGAGSAAGERSRLRGYVESFLRMEFLPAVYVDYRARAASMLEDPEAFRPRARLRGAAAVAGEGGGGAGRPGLLPAALATEAVVEELLGCAALMPPFATHLTGVVENILGRVLEAFIGQLAGAAAGSTSGRLAESVPLVRLMAREPSATLLGSPVAFFVGGNTDAMESFVSSVIAAGFGANDESVEREVLAKLLAERPLQPGALLCGGGDARRLTLLAALSDSCDYIAEVIQRCTAAWGLSGGGSVAATPRPFGAGAAGQGGQALPLGVPTPGGGGAGGGALGVTSRGELPSLLPTPRTSGEGGWAGRLVGGWRGRNSTERGLTEGLAHLADRYRAVAGACMRVMRLDLLLLVVAQMGELPRSRYVCTEEEGKEVDECVGALSRSVSRLDEELSAFLPPHKRAYAFCSLAPAAARIAVWLLPELGEMNHNGVSRMCRMLASLQPVLLGVGGPVAAGPHGGTPSATPSASSRPEAARQFDKAKLYYTLLTYSPEGLLATVAEKPRRFSPAEYAALLAASVPERAPVTPEHRAQLQRTLEAAGAGGKGGGKGGGSKGGAALAAFVKAVVKPQQSQSHSQSL